MRKICLLLMMSHVFVMGFSQSKKLVGETIVIPLDHSSMRPIVKMMINDKGPYDFIFDTGSSTNVIDERLVKEFNFELVGQDSLKSQGASNLISKRVAVPNVAFANTRISQDIEMNVVALRKMLPIDGVLSPAFLKDYLITLDYPESKLILSQGHLVKNDPGVIDYSQQSSAINLNVSVDGKTVKTHLDSGSPGSLSLPYSMKDLLTFEEKPFYDGEIRTPVSSYKKWRAKLRGEVKLGEVIYKNPMVSLVQGFDYANIGYQLIKDLRISIDKKNNLIQFEKPMPKAKPEDLSYIPGDGFTGWYGGKVRNVFEEGAELFLKRGGFTVKLEPLEGDLFKMTYHIPVNNELPNVRFDREAGGRVIGLTFIYKDGREDEVKKDL